MGIANRLRIITGSDRSPLTRIRNPRTKDPLDLTGATKIQFVFDRRNRTKLVLDTTQVPAIKAQETEPSSEITFIAMNGGANGNDIILQFDGVSDIDTIIAEWNTANSGNSVTHNGNGDEILEEQTIRLTGGYNAYFPVEIWGNPVLGKVIVRLLERDTEELKRGPNQTFTVIVDYGTFPGGNRVIGKYSNLEVYRD